jgi:Flp pilus assembly protein TadD
VVLDRLSEALALVDASENQFDDDSSVALLGARIAVMMGDVNGALERFQNPAIQNAGSRIATEELGSLLANQGHCVEAIRVLQPLYALTDGPEMSAEARRSLAKCYLKGNEAPLAIKVLSEHAVADPADTASQLLLAKAALVDGEYMIALQAIELARRSKPDSADFEVLLATTHWKRGDFSSAESVLDGILDKNPADVDAWCLLGEVLQASNRGEDAKNAFERALFLEPNCRWAAEKSAGKGGQFTQQRPAEKKIPEKS